MQKFKGKLSPEVKAYLKQIKEKPPEALTVEEAYQRSVDWAYSNMPARFELSRDDVERLLRRRSA